MESEKWNYILIAEGTLNTLSVYHKGLSESMPVEDRWYFQNLTDALQQLLGFDRHDFDISQDPDRPRADKRYHTIRIVEGPSQEAIVKVAYFNAVESAAAGLRAGIYASICTDPALFSITCGIDLEAQGILHPGTNLVPLAYLEKEPAAPLTISGEKNEFLQLLQHVRVSDASRWKYCHQIQEHQMANTVATLPDVVVNSYYHYFDIAMPLRAVLLTEPNLMEITAISSLLPDVHMIQTSSVVDAQKRPQFSLQCAYEKKDDKDRQLLGIYCKFERDIREVEKEAHIDLSDITANAVGPEIPLYQYHRDLRIFYGSTGMQFLKMHLQDDLLPAAVDRLHQRYIIELAWARHKDPLTADIRIGNDQRRQVQDLGEAVKLLLSVHDELFSSTAMASAKRQYYLREIVLIDTADNTAVLSKYLYNTADPRLEGHLIVDVQLGKVTTEVFTQLQRYAAAHMDKVGALKILNKFGGPQARKSGDGQGPKL